MKYPLLKVEKLSVCYKNTDALAVHNLSFALRERESVGLIGESGSGKSSLALTIMGLLRSSAEVHGSIRLKNVELTCLPEQELENYRWSKIALVFQNSLEVLNPVMTIGEQIAECIRRHLGLNNLQAKKKTTELLLMTGLDPLWAKAYPHQLSGGMRQKVLIAMALSCDPEVLLVDEPTMALDAANKDEIIKLLLSLQKEKGFSMLVISHEFPVISAMTSRLLVIYSGNVVEEGNTQEVINNPMHPYTRGLVYASPAVNPYRDMWGIPGEATMPSENQCSFLNRCSQRIDRCACELPVLQTVCEDRRVACTRGGIVTLLKGSSLCKCFHVRFREIMACSSCDIEVKAGEVTALIGESGSGKTTIAKILAGILHADRGEVFFQDRKVSGNSETSKRGGVQIVFQDALSATNEHFSIEEIVREPLDIIKWGTKNERLKIVKEALKNVQLPSDDLFLRRRAYTLSGGQRQRTAIARALVMTPKLLIADEISAMLDPSTAANLLRLLKGLQIAQGFTMLYITHDLALAQKISDKVYVMSKGKIIGHGPVRNVFRENRSICLG